MKTRRIGAPLRFDDLYHVAMSMSWLSFAASVTCCFALINLAFGCIYACLPGAIIHARAGSLSDGIFFSVQTLATVGYGYLYPGTFTTNVISSAEVLVGLFFSATTYGLIFARFSLPQVGVQFGKSAVIGLHQGQPALMIRVVSTRSRPLADASAQVAWLELNDDANEVLSRKLTPLPLVCDNNHLFGISWTLVHVLEDDQRFIDAVKGDDRFYVSVIIRGTDVLLSNQNIFTRLYRREEILIDRMFCQMLIPKGNELIVDMRRLNATRPISDQD